MKHVSYFIKKLYGARLNDIQHWRSDEPPATDKERERVRQVIRKVISDREEMDRQYVQERMDLGVCVYDPYTDVLRSVPVHLPHEPKPSGLAVKAHKRMLEARYGKK